MKDSIGKELKVIIIDDDDVVLFLHKSFAKTSGFVSEAVLSKSGKTAFEFLKLHDEVNATYLLLLDINMPGMSGWDLLDAINLHNFAAQIHVIIVTSSINIVDREKASLYKRVIDFRVKPVTLAILTELKQLPELKHFFNH